jgi:hypothetical protein
MNRFFTDYEKNAPVKWFYKPFNEDIFSILCQVPPCSGIFQTTQTNLWTYYEYSKDNKQ